MIGGLGFIGVNLADRLIAEGARHDPDAAARASRRQADDARAPGRRDRRRRPARSRADAGSSSPASTWSSTCRDSRAPCAAWKIRGRISTSTCAATWCCSSRCARATAAPRSCSPVAPAVRQAGRAAGRRRRPRRSAVPARDPQADGRGVSEAVRAPVRLRFTIARITNPYGPGQPKGRTAYGVINRLIHLALADRRADDLRRRRAAARLRSRRRCRRRAAADGRFAAGERPRLQRRQRRRDTSWSTWPTQIIAIAGGGRIEHVAWPALAQQIETGDFVADISRIEARARLGADSARLRAGLEETVAHYRGALGREPARARASSISRTRFMVGGAEEMVLNLVRHLPPRFEPRWCCIHNAGPIGEEIRKTGVPFHALGLTPGLRRPFDVLAPAAVHPRVASRPSCTRSC